MKTNEGEVPQYYVDDSHEAIIPPDEWEKVQKEFVRRKAMGRKYSGNSVFATKIVCGDCGAFFGSKVWNSTSEKNIAEPYGNAMTNSKAIKNAAPLT